MVSRAVLRTSDLVEWLPSLTRHRFGLTRLGRPVSIDFYDQWLKAGYHGEMSYLARHRDLKAHPENWLPFARSALVFAIEYVSENDYVTADCSKDTSVSSLRTALYTRYAPKNADYHDVIRAELQPVLEALQAKYPEETFRFALDAEPVLERDLAVRAGLGWTGKNTCVIDRARGSLFFIAEILCSLETAEVAPLIADHCGTCTRCLEACPTGALLEPRRLDATKCISYWTIESKQIPPADLRMKFDDWFFGCDICQTVCPWNGKVFGRERMQNEVSPNIERAALIEELRGILISSNRELEKRFMGTPLSRARGFGLKRNALVVAGNKRLTELSPEIERFVSDEKLGLLAQETLMLLNGTAV